MKNEIAEEGSVLGRVCFSKEETERLHAVGKAHGRTVTQVATALLTLATAEVALRTAGSEGIERYQYIADTFAKATHLFSGMNAVNMVSLHDTRIIASEISLYTDISGTNSHPNTKHSIPSSARRSFALTACRSHFRWNHIGN